ncbi:TolC family protein [Intestinibacillus sp. Marseille-P6563]|uniref:TolC family protein n=1 Tax=Intestinibacillus sp. Marseille-P6563 TaxID=2364792 RepID=UPI000F072357|nr:TolC family protein [Intestinibacillus sp. Marseille-P6563]
MMGKKAIAMLAAGAMAVGLTTPAGAIAGMDAGLALTLGGAQAVIDTSMSESGMTPPLQDSKSIGFYGLEKTVRANNQTIQSLQKTLASVGSTDVVGPIEDQIWNYEMQNSNLEAQKNSYEKAAQNLRNQLNQVSGNADLEASLKAQIEQMNTLANNAAANIQKNQAVINGLEDSKDDAPADLADTYATTEKQVENSANQIVMGAQTQYISLCTMQDNIEALDRTIAAIDRQLPVVEKQYEIGMATALDVENLKNQRAAAVSSKLTLENQIASIENSLSLTLGNDAGTTVHVQKVPEVTDRQLREMNYEKDLEEAKTNSYTIWQKRDALRKASNDYEDDVTSTLDAYNAAKIDLAAAQEQVENDFRKLFNDVSEKKRLLDKAESDLELAESNYKVAETKYEKGMISKLEYENAQDTLETAKAAITTAQTDLFTAYNTYDWAKRGVM